MPKKNVKSVLKGKSETSTKKNPSFCWYITVSLVWGFWKWLVFWLGGKWSRFIADSKQKCFNRIVGDTRIGEFWFREKWSGIYFPSTWKAQNQPILSINAVSSEIAKRRILAALWSSPVLSVLQTENLKWKASHLDWRILYNIYTSLLPTCPP